MKKEEIYLDLSKLSESERKEVFELLPPKKNPYDYLITFFCNKLCFNNYWYVTNISNVPTKTEITFNQFKELFNTIELDKTKAYDLRDLNEEQFLIIQNEFKKDGYWIIDEYEEIREYSFVHFDSCRWFEEENDKQIINALTLFKPKLKIGDTFEHNGFICRVETVKKEPIKVGDWIMNDRKMFFKYEKWMCDSHLWMKITDQEFINQLEKHAR